MQQPPGGAGGARPQAGLLLLAVPVLLLLLLLLLSEVVAGVFLALVVLRYGEGEVGGSSVCGCVEPRFRPLARLSVWAGVCVCVRVRNVPSSDAPAAVGTSLYVSFCVPPPPPPRSVGAK